MAENEISVGCFGGEGMVKPNGQRAKSQGRAVLALTVQKALVLKVLKVL